VYRHDENGWSKREDGNWNPISRNSRTSPTDLASRRDSLKTKHSEITEKRGTSGKSSRAEVSKKRTGSRPSRSQHRSFNTSTRNFKTRGTYSGLQRDRSARSRGSYRTRQHRSMRSTAHRGRSRGSRGGSRGRR
jgi:hypothetical protein